MKCLWIVPAIVVIPWLCDLWPLKWFGLYILDLDGYLFFPIGSLLALYGIDIERKISFKSTLAFFVLPWLACNTAKAVIATFEDSTGPTKILFLDIKVLLYKISLPFGRRLKTSTAAGDAIAYLSRLETVKVGHIILSDVEAAIVPKMQTNYILLGMSFLKHIELIQRDGLLTLRQRG